MQMQDNAVMVTGGASGIGRGICVVMAERGADVAVADIDLEGAKKVEGELAKYGHRAKAFQVDVTKRAELEELVKAVTAQFIYPTCNCRSVPGSSRECTWVEGKV